MNFLSVFAISFCASSVFIGALYMICPDGAINRSVKYIFACVFILMVVSSAIPLSKGIEFDFEGFETDSIETDSMDEQTIWYTYAIALEKAGIDFEEIEVCTDKSEKDDIYISKVIIYSECEKSFIEKALGVEYSNIEVEIINEQDAK